MNESERVVKGKRTIDRKLILVALISFTLGFAACALMLDRYKELSTKLILDRWTKNIYGPTGEWRGRIK